MPKGTTPSLSTRKRPVRRVYALNGHLAIGAYARFSTEREIQASICELLDFLALPYSVTDASRSYGVDGRVRGSKVRKGWPDITGCFANGQLFAIEVKKPGGRVSAEQKEMLKRLQESKAAVCVAYSVAEAVDFLQLKGGLSWSQRSFLSQWRQ